MAHDDVTNENRGDQSDEMSVEERLTALEDRNHELEAQLEQQQEGGVSNVTRRGALGVLGGGALLGAAGSASAQRGGGAPFADEDHDHSGDYLGKGESVDQIDVNGLNTDSLSSITILQAGLDESEVRDKVSNASSNSAFVVEPGAQWTLQDTLEVPQETGLYGFDFVGNTKTTHYTFKKGFDGPLVNLQGYTELRGISLLGNRTGGYSGDGIVLANDEQPTPLSHISRVRIGFCAGDGLVLDQAAFWNYFNQVFCFLNGGWGVHYVPTPSHYSQNMFDRCQFSKNGSGGILYEHLDHATVYDGVTFSQNKGPAIEFRDSDYEITGLDGYNLAMRNGNFINNEGPAWLHRGGNATNVVFQDTQLAKNAGSPSTDLTPPIGQFHIEGGSVDIEIRGGTAFGDDHLYTATKASNNQNLEINGSARNEINGDVYGYNTYLTLQNASIVTGDINVKSGIGLNPNQGGSVEHYGPFEEPTTSAYTVPQQSLTIDGDTSELDDTSSLNIDEDFGVYTGTYTKGGTLWWRWDADNLYLAADLRDNNHVQTQDGSTTYQDDVVQCGIAPGAPGTGGPWDQLDIALTDNGPQVYRRVLPDGSISREMTAATVEIVRTNDAHTIYEVALPWSNLKASSSNDILGLSLAVHDVDDDGATGWVEWGGGLLGGKNAAEFNRADLTGN